MRLIRVAPVRAALLALIVLAAVLAGCGDTKVVHERDVKVPGSGTTTSRAEAEMPDAPSGTVRIVVVTHGQASSPFWAIVRNGVEAAARQMDALVEYRAPDVYSLERMRTLIDQAVATHPDGLVVSLPETKILPTVRRAVRAGVPVVSINSGSDVATKLGVLAHVGQPEDRAGLRAGQRLARAGVRNALCVNNQPGNQGLDARCAGLERAMRAAGGRSEVLGIDDQNPRTPGKIAAVVRRDGIDGVLALNGTGGGIAAKTVRRVDPSGHTPVATFDLGPDVLDDLRRGRLLFAVDQQPYLQGYLPVVLLAQRARYGLFPAQGDVIPTGPNFVTRATAERALQLSRQSIR
jgi:simple sugar transport system substrate-binding protein